jgi:hypothetical protein
MIHKNTANTQYLPEYGFFEIVRETKCYFFLKSYKKTVETYSEYVIFRQFPKEKAFNTHVNELEDKEIKVSKKEYNKNMEYIKTVDINEGDKYINGKKINPDDMFYFYKSIRDLCSLSKTYICHLNDIENYNNDYYKNSLTEHNEELMDNKIYPIYARMNKEQIKYFNNWLKSNVLYKFEEGTNLYNKLYNDIAACDKLYNDLN